MSYTSPGRQRRNGAFRTFVSLLVVIGLIAGARLVYDHYIKHPAPAAIQYPQHPTFTSPDGNVMLTVPDRAMDKGTTVTFTRGPQYADTINKGRLAFKALASPVDIMPQNGKLMSDKSAVTIKYDPAQIPKGLSAKQVGMAVFDPNLDSWIPILNAVADPSTSSVTALAPHFSWFSAIVLDPAKNVVEAGGKTIKTVIDATTTVVSWTYNLISTLTGDLVDDLFARVDEATCNPVSGQVTASTAGDFNLLKACVQGANANDQLKLTNGYAFPLRSNDKLPAGTQLTWNDIQGNGGGLADLIRSWFWSTQGKIYSSGAAHASLTITPDMKSSAKVGMDIDSDAIAFDVGLAVFSVFAPEKSVIESTLKAAVAAGSISKIGAATGTAASWAYAASDGLDCIVSNYHDAADQLYTQQGYQQSASVVHDCLGQVLDKLSLKGALAALLTSLKSIPATIEGVVYTAGGALLDNVGSQFTGVKQTPISFTLSRKGGNTSQSGGQTGSASPKPNWGQYAGFLGTWQAADTTLTINDDGAGTYRSNFSFCSSQSNSDQIAWCTVTGKLWVTGLGNGRLGINFGTPTARNKDGNVIPLAPEVLARFNGKSVYADYTSDPGIIVTSSPSGLNDEAFSDNHFCKPQVFTQSQDPNSQYWAVCK